LELEDAVGRKYKQYEFMDKKLFGLSKIGPNRWRISQTGERYTESDEYRAVQYFLQQTAEERETVFVPIAKGTPSENAQVLDSLYDGGFDFDQIEIESADGKEWDEDDAEHIVGHRIDRKAVMAWFRRQLLKNPDRVAQETGIPQLASFASLRLPTEPLSPWIVTTSCVFSAECRNCRVTKLVLRNRQQTVCLKYAID
jgi:hypothetical protein